jgi:hypothetical protein
MSISDWLVRTASAPAPLIEIRRRYSATCYDLKMTVENDSDGWSVEVRDRERGTKLHSARRCSLAAAKLAATEFAVVRMTGGKGAATVEVMASHLPWSESWS